MRTIIKFNECNFDVTYIDLVFRLKDSAAIYFIYNGKTFSFYFNSEEERNKKYKKLLDMMVQSNMVLLYDNDRDIINFSNVILINDPTYDNIGMRIPIMFKSYQTSILLPYNDVGDLNNFKQQMEPVFDKILKIWVDNVPALYQPFHTIDLF